MTTHITELPFQWDISNWIQLVDVLPLDGRSRNAVFYLKFKKQQRRLNPKTQQMKTGLSTKNLLINQLETARQRSIAPNQF